MSERYVIDAFALLVLLREEASYRMVKQLLEQAESGQVALFLTEINWGEVYYSVVKKHGEVAGRKALSTMELLPLNFVVTTRDLVLAAAKIKARFPVSYADAFAIAAAQELDCPVVTGDPEFRRVEQAGVVRVMWVGESEQ